MSDLISELAKRLFVAESRLNKISDSDFQYLYEIKNSSSFNLVKWRVRLIKSIYSNELSDDFSLLTLKRFSLPDKKVSAIIKVFPPYNNSKNWRVLFQILHEIEINDVTGEEVYL